MKIGWPEAFPHPISSCLCVWLDSLAHNFCIAEARKQHATENTQKRANDGVKYFEFSLLFLLQPDRDTFFLLTGVCVFFAVRLTLYQVERPRETIAEQQHQRAESSYLS